MYLGTPIWPPKKNSAGANDITSIFIHELSFECCAMFTGSKGCVTRSHVYSSITYCDLNQQQIDLHYNCMVNLTGNTVK